MRVAIVHDWLTVIGGAERVLQQLLQVFPDADVYSVINCLGPAEREWLGARRYHTSVLQRIPFVGRFYRTLLPLMPLAVEQWDFSGYDLVVSSSYAVVKGVVTSPDTLHVSYVHSPMRYAWDLQGQYVTGWGPRRLAMAYLLHRIRMWDQLSALRVDKFLANSAFVAGRIRKFYRREAQVVPPPVDLDRFTLSREVGEHFLVVSRMVPYKRVDAIVAAFRSLPELKLTVIGDGPEMERVRALAGANVTLLGAQPDEVVTRWMRTCRALVFAAVEDFGITPVEAQACGKPVIALGRGGALETLVGQGAQPTALFFERQDADSIAAAVRRFVAEEASFDPEACRRNAERFSADRFRAAILDAVLSARSAATAPEAHGMPARP